MPVWVGTSSEWQASGEALGVAICPNCKKPAWFRLFAKSRSFRMGVFTVRDVASWDTKKRMLVCGKCQRGAQVSSVEEARTLFDQLQFAEWDHHLRVLRGRVGNQHLEQSFRQLVASLQMKAGAGDWTEMNQLLSGGSQSALNERITRYLAARGVSLAAPARPTAAAPAPPPVRQQVEHETARPATGKRGPDRLYDRGRSAKARLYEAGEHNDVVAAAMAITDGAPVNGYSRDHEYAALWAACNYGAADVVRLLLEQGADPNGVIGIQRQMPLTLAAQSGHTDVVRLLLQYGANVEQVDSFGNQTALHFAAMKGSLEMVAALLEAGANPNARGKGKPNWTPLKLAKHYGFTQVADLLVRSGARE